MFFPLQFFCFRSTRTQKVPLSKQVPPTRRRGRRRSLRRRDGTGSDGVHLTVGSTTKARAPLPICVMERRCRILLPARTAVAIATARHDPAEGKSWHSSVPGTRPSRGGIPARRRRRDWGRTTPSLRAVPLPLDMVAAVVKWLLWLWLWLPCCCCEALVT